jgi:type IV secretion system protein VirD4
MKFCDYDGIQSVFDGHDFDLNELKTGKMTLYLVLPATRLSTCKGLICIFLNLTLAMVEVETTKPEYPILAILDELPVLGYMKQLEDAIGQVAGLGLRLHCILQDLGQLKAIYGDRFESFLANSGVLNFFGNTDAFTSQWISDYLGKTAIRVAEQNALSIADKKQGRPSQNFRNQVTELLSPSEVRRYIARSDYLNRQLVIFPGQRPWVLQKANYDQHELFKGRFDEWR